MKIRVLLLTKASLDGVMLALFDAKYSIVPGFKGEGYIDGDSPCWFCAEVPSVPDSDTDRTLSMAEKVADSLNSRGVSWLALQVGPGGGAVRIGMKFGQEKDPYRSPAT